MGRCAVGLTGKGLGGGARHSLVTTLPPMDDPYLMPLLEEHEDAVKNKPHRSRPMRFACAPHPELIRVGEAGHD